MIPVKPPEGDFRFRMIGGGLQLRLESAEDLPNVLKLDEAFWAMTGIDLDSLRFDRRFLEFVDSDHDGQIRCDEVKEAVRFVLENFRDLNGLLSGSDKILPEAVNPDAPGMLEVIDCAGLLLKNLGREKGDGLSVREIMDTRISTSFSRRNGDGIISDDGDFSAEIRRMIASIIASGRSSQDLSGNPGVSLADVENFEKAALKRIGSLNSAENDPAIMVYGRETAAVNGLFRECEPLLDSYFLNLAAGEFLQPDPERTAKKGFAADLMIPDDVRQALEKASVADPGIGSCRGLDFSAPLNPLYAGKLRELAASAALSGYLDGTILTEEKYRAAKAALAPFAAYQASFDQDDGLAEMSVQDFTFSPEIYSELKKMIANDLSLAPVISAGENLLKLALYQQNLLALLNNFVSLPDLFDPDNPSRLQMGKLIMDGRHFTLAVKVKNPAEHKRIIQGSNICIIYIEVTGKSGSSIKKQLLAAAVTHGTMRSLFVGKHGVFFDADGAICDAVIKDMVEQPVSIGEALKSPFFKFADFFSKQTEKIFSTRNAALQKNISAEMSKSSAAALPPGKSAAVPPVPASNTGGAGNLSMILMGGGIGVAALGSSVAFIANSLQNVSICTVLAVIAGIIVIFGGPPVFIALIKLFRRDLSRFLESCGCAVNRPMRMSRKMGTIFTFSPKRPKGEITWIDPANIFRPAVNLVKKRIFIALLVIVLGGVCGVAAAYFYVKNLEKRELKETAAEKVVEEVEKPQKNKTKPAAAENVSAEKGGEKKEK